MARASRHRVTIKVSAINGELDFTYDPSVLHVSKRDTVQWFCNDGPFAVEFKEDTPGNEVGVRGHEVGSGNDVGVRGNQNGKHWESQPFAIRPDARGHYHYAVAVAVNNRTETDPIRGQVALDAACPEIIVN